MNGHRRLTRTRRTGTALTLLALAAPFAVATVALAPSSNAYDPSRNILANWNFADPPLSSGSLTVTAGSSVITGWDVTSGDVDLVASSEVSNGGTLNGVPNQAVDLNGSGPGAISQTFPTTPGYTYTGDYFFFSAANPTVPVVKTATLTVGGTSTAISYDSSTPNGWQQKSFSFKATGSMSTIAFASTTPGADGPLIGLVEVYPPYPLYLDPVRNVVVY